MRRGEHSGHGYTSNVLTRTDTNGDVFTFNYDNTGQLTGKSQRKGVVRHN